MRLSVLQLRVVVWLSHQYVTMHSRSLESRNLLRSTGSLYVNGCVRQSDSRLTDSLNNFRTLINQSIPPTHHVLTRAVPPDVAPHDDIRTAAVYVADHVRPEDGQGGLKS